MFQRFTKAAKVVVRDAVHIAEQERATLIRPEHLLLAMLNQDGTTATKILADHAVTTAAVTDALDRAHRRGGLSDAESAALTEVGIDVDAVVAALEQTHGEGALTPAKRPRTFGPRWRVAFDPAAKKVIERCLRETLDRGDRSIGDEHVLLALLSVGGVAAEVLTSLGVTHQGVRAYLARAC
ncbi:MAG TPA: Clp protease N-terminal domain-containing protein [Actinokineospora sp.]|nr:Clp protease N-terminal domain-containing protein [Actinokineospora sp.]